MYAPGLHFKSRLSESVKMLDARIQTMDNRADRFVTKERKDLIVDSYIKWRIQRLQPLLRQPAAATSPGPRYC